MKQLFILLFIALFAHLPVEGAAKGVPRAEYKVIKVIDGGNLSGKALFAGPVIPKDEVLKLTSERALCGEALPAGKYLINENREIKNVIVW